MRLIFDRYTFKANSEFKVTDRIRVGQSFNISYSERVAAVGGQSTGGDISFVYRADPIIPVYDIAGNYAGTQSASLGNGINPVASAQRNKDNLDRRIRALGNVYAEIDLLKGLTFKSNIGLDYRGYHLSSFQFLNPEVKEPNNVNRLNEFTSYNISTTWFNTLDYNTSFGKHGFNVLLGTEFLKINLKNSVLLEVISLPTL